MISLDLAAVANQLQSRSGSVRASWVGGNIKVDEHAFVAAVATAAATAMGQNIYAGKMPDGSGAMPGRMKDGVPRGKGSAIARAISSVSIGTGVWLLAAHREIQGHMARIMRDVPFRAPPIASLGFAIRRAFERAVKLGTEGPREEGVGSSLFQGSRKVWSGGKRVAVGKLFNGGGSTAFNDIPNPRQIKQVFARLRSKVNGPRPAGVKRPRSQSVRGGWGSL